MRRFLESWFAPLRLSLAPFVAFALTARWTFADWSCYKGRGLRSPV
jgi:hypothetical protein